MLKIITTLVATLFIGARGQGTTPSQPAISSIDSGQVSADPNIVGQKLAQLTVQFFTTVDVPIGSLIEVTVPGESTVQTGYILCAIAGWNDDDGLQCEGLDDKTLQFPLKHNLRAFEQNVFRFSEAFNAPLTGDPTESFIVKIFNADKSFLLAEGDSGIQLSLLEPNVLVSASVSQIGDSSTVVGQETQIVVSVTTLNPIPAGGGLQISLPKWNTQAQESNRVSYIIAGDGAPLCSIGSGMEQITCDLIVTPNGDTLVVKDMFPNAERLAGDTFTFVINRVRNPLSMSPVDLTITTFSSILFEAIGLQVSYKGLIDRSPAAFQALLPAPIDPTSAIINADVTTVSEQSQLIIPFKIPVPVQLDLGCTILITLPEDFDIVAGKLTIFRGWGIFQGVSELVADIDIQQRTIKIADQCVKYTAANVQNTIRVGYVQNPYLVKSTADFKIQIQDNNGMLIASVESGVAYTPTPGTFEAISLVPHSASIEVQEVTDVELVFTPKHPLSQKGKLHIKMPTDLPAKCDIVTTTGGIELILNCTVLNDNTIVLDNPFRNNAFLGDSQLSITFRALKLPDSQRPILGITLESYDMDTGQYYLVDRFQSLTYQFFTPSSIQFLYSSVARLTSLTFTETQFRISNTIASDVPIGSTMVLTLPKQITVNSEVSVMSSCNTVLNMSPDMVCKIVANTDESPDQIPDGTHTITIKGAFDTPKLKNDELIFSIKRGLVTPISTETTDTFKMYIYDSMGYEINFIREALAITMQQGLSIETIEVEPDSYRVGDTSNHKISFQTPVPLLEGFKLQIFVPENVITPRAADIVCVGESPLVADLKCQLNGNRVTMELVTLGPVGVDTNIQIKIGPMVNPGSTFPTEPYQLSIRSDTWYEVAEELNHPGGKVQMKDPSIIQDYSFEVFDLRQKALTTVTINWVSTQTYPKDTKIVIDYDQTQISPVFASPDIKEVDCIFRESRVKKCTFEYNQIFVSDIMPSEEYSNSKMELTITNMIINVVTPLTTESWVLTTYLNDGRSKIDQIQSDMTLTFDCNYPCQTCAIGQPDMCTSCNTIEGDQILYESKCYLQCPSGTFFEYFTCQLCDQKCKTCQYTSGTSCTSCNAESAYPYLNGKDCSATCNYGEFGNALTSECETCTYPCEQCTETADKCTACRQDSLDKYYFDYTCLPECPLGQYVQLEARNNVCLPCSDNCLTCELTSDTCSSCGPGLILNHLDQTCVAVCPSDLTIYTPANTTKPYESCEPCKSSCKTCKDDINTCTSCRNPLSLKKEESKCVLECDVFFQSQVSINNVCIGCSSSCLRCQGTPDYCIKCVPGTFFYQNTCVKQCPMIDDYQYEPDEEGICVINGLRCPFGFKVNEFGNACVLQNQVCEKDYELNHDKTACVPISTFYIPFPILITMILFCIVPIVSKVKCRNSKIVPNFTVVISFFETVCMIVLVAQAYDYGIIPTFYLAVVGLIFLFAGNMFFMLMYTQQVVNDSAFKHWQPKYSRTSKVIQGFGALNFKMYRLMYSLLFGRNQFNAPFNEPSLFLRPFNLTSLFAIVTVTLPIIVSSIIGLIYVRWGYQLYITCIEMLVIEFALVVLQIVEYFQQKFVQKKYFKVTKKQVEVKVCSDFPDSDENDEYGTKLDKSKSRPKSIKAVRHLANVVSRMQGKEDFAGENRREVEQEIEELHVEDMMHRQLRHCQSFRDIRPTLNEAFSGDQSGEDKWQDFISEPASPRSKEMLFNRKFVGRMHYLHDVYKMRDQFDNCYHEPVDHTTPSRKPVTKRVQTNVLEMLGIDDARMTHEIDQELQVEQVADFDLANNRRKRLSKKRIMEIPDFEFDDIMGEFEADENGQFLLVKKQGRLHDKKGRLVNRRGYLIDQIGNVINRLGKMIFRVDELSPEDDELPDPFCFEKVKALQSRQHEVQFRVALHSQIVEDKAKLDMQNLLIDQEYQDQKMKRKPSEKSSKLQESANDDSSEHPVQTSVRDEEEAFIQKLTQPKQPKTKNQFISAQGRKAQSQASKERLVPQKDDTSEPVFTAMRPPSQTSLHRVEQLQEMIQMKDLQFNNQKRGNAAPQRQNQASLNRYVPGQDIAKVYQDNDIRLNSQRQKVLLDQDFLGKLERFNKQLDSKRKEGKYLHSDNAASEIANQMENRGLAHRNLSSVYGRVKQKFNQNITVKETSGPSATINKRVDNRMEELEGIYLRPQVIGKESKRHDQGMPSATDSLDLTKQLQNLHHLKSVQSVQSMQISAIDAKSQNQVRDRPSMA